MLTSAASHLARASHVVALTGAGVSAASGIPTFRDALTGLWSRYDPTQLATPEAFARDPGLVTRWYDERRLRCARCEPNSAHHALVAIERTLASRGSTFTLVTQNVDRLHTRAGSRPIELHGSLFTWRCTRTHTEFDPPLEPFETYPPLSPQGHPARPGVIWFGEALPEHAINQALEAVGSCDVFITIGTSAVVYPAAGLVHVAKRAGATAIEINRHATPATREVDLAIQADAAEALPAIAEAL